MIHGKGMRLPQLQALALAVQAAWGFSAWALPQGASVVNGQVTMSQPAGNVLQIQASHGAIINWQQFSIQSGEVARFVQPNAQSAVLNRVTGPDISQLFGQLNANGQVFLINPNGIVIGGAARIDTNSFIASTLDINDADFLAGKLRFHSQHGAGRIRNEGTITAGPGGSIALIAPDVENSGIIHAPDGNILLAAGRKLEITSMDLAGVNFEIQAPHNSALNLGKLLAENGAVRVFAGSLQNLGEIRASSLEQDAAGNIVLSGSREVTLGAGSLTSASGADGGQILIQSAQGEAHVAGRVEAVGSAGQGGEIQILGERVAVAEGAVVDASGATGGGKILVGGDFQGANAGVQNAERTYVGAGAKLKADATEQGDGGTVIVWADENTRFYGDLSARGGAAGGDGGFAEISGKVNLEYDGTADLSAPKGALGDLLFDPLDIIISLTSGILPSVVDAFTDFASNIVTISPAKLAAVAANVTLQAERDIFVKDAIELTHNGAGISMTAGGATYTAGSIYNDAGISTNNGAITLRASTISGNGVIDSGGGAIDILTHSSLNHSGMIASHGGAIMLGSEASSVNGLTVDAGSGTITVVGQSGVFNGSYTTTGTLNLSATSGSISVYDIHAATANLTASSSINAYVDVTDRVNATSTGSSIYISNNSSGPLRVGTLTANNTLSLNTSGGIIQAPGGMLHAPLIDLYNNTSGTETIGTALMPLQIGSSPTGSDPRIRVHDIETAAFLNVASDVTIGELSFSGSVEGIGNSVVQGSANLTSLDLSANSGSLEVSAVSTGGFANGLSFDVWDGGINAPTLTLPGGEVELMAQGPVSVGSMSGASLYIYAHGAVTVGNATTTGSGGIDITANGCQNDYATACSLNSPINIGTLNAGTDGDIDLALYDNGALTVSGALIGDDIDLNVGQAYYTSGYPYYHYQATTNSINVASVTAYDRFTSYHQGKGDTTIGSLTAGGSVYIYAGSTDRVPNVNFPYYTDVISNNNITVTNVEPATPSGSFQIDNSGVGNVVLNGNVNRPDGSVNLRTSDGSITALGDLTGNWEVGVTSNSDTAPAPVNLGNLTSLMDSVNITSAGSLNVNNVSAGSGSSNFSNVTLTAEGDISFANLSALTNDVYAGNGSVTVTSYSGFVRTTQNNNAFDITATGDVHISAEDMTGGSIGNSAFANPLDVLAGLDNSVTLHSGGGIGATGKAVRIDTMGTIDVRSTGGQFHIAATDGTNERDVAVTRLSASAGGIGSGGTSTFTSAGLDITANSDGSIITIGDLLLNTGNLDEFAFNAQSSALIFGDVNLATGGMNRLVLDAGNGLSQVDPLVSDHIQAGSILLNGGSGDVNLGNVTSQAVDGNRISIVGADISAGTLTGRSVVLTGANIDVDALTTDGLNRVNLGSLVADGVRVSGSEDVNINGAVLSATHVDISAGGDLMINGTVTTTGTGRSYTSASYSYAPYYFADMTPDRITLEAGGDLMTAGSISSQTALTATAGGDLTVGGGGSISTTGTYSGNFYENADQVSVSAGIASTLTTQAITGGYDKEVTAGTLDIAGGITGAGRHTTVTGTVFNTGDLITGSTLTINANAGYVPTSGTSMAITANTVTINASNDIEIDSGVNNVVLTAPTVNLNSANGNVRAELFDTTTLTIDTAKGFDVFSDTWLNSVDITAQWDQVTNSLGNTGSVGGMLSSNSVTGTQDFTITGSGPVAMDLDASAGGPTWNFRYTDVSVNAPSAVNLDINRDATGFADFEFASATPVNVTANMGMANLSVGTYGAVDLVLVTTQGGAVNARSYADTVMATQVATNGGSFVAVADASTVELGTVSTSGGALHATAHDDVIYSMLDTSGPSNGGSVFLTSYNGDIRSSMTPAHAINVSENGTGASGTVTLSAELGSIGSGIAPVVIDYATALTLTAQDDIRVEANNSTLSSLSVTTDAGGSGLVSIAGTHNFAGLSITRVDSGANLLLGALAPSTAGSFSLTARDGGIRVGGDLTNLNALTLDAQGGDLDITSSSHGARTVTSTGAVNLFAGQDILLLAGDEASESLSITGAHFRVQADRDLLVLGDGGSVSLSSSGSVLQQWATAGRDFILEGGGTAGAFASIEMSGSTNTQTLSAGRDWIVRGGAGTGAYALFDASDTSHQSLNVGQDLIVQGGQGQDATARLLQNIGSGSGQTFSVGRDLTIRGGNASAGQGTGAFAEIVGSAQNYNIAGDLMVHGGTAADTSGVLRSNSSQNLGDVFSGSGPITNSVIVQGGSGDRAHAHIVASGTQTIYAAVEGGSVGDVHVMGGSATDASAEIRTTGSQTIGAQATSCSFSGCNYPTNDVLVHAGTGDGAFASLLGASQNVRAGGALQVVGGDGVGAYAQIRSTSGSQNVGSSSTSSNNPTESVLVQAGSGGIARILAAGSQTVHSANNISVLGGSGANMTASIETTGGSQTISNTSIFSNDPTGNLLLQAGSGTGSSVWIRATSTQSIDAGGTIVLTAGADANAFAEISTTAGTQTIGNVTSFNTDRTDSITLTGGGMAGSYASIHSGGSQNVRADGGILLTGGTGDGSGALLSSTTGQTLTTNAGLTIEGGVADTAGGNHSGLRNLTSGNQTISTYSDIRLTGGSGGADTLLANDGTGAQTVSTSTGSLYLIAPAANINAGGRVGMSTASGQQNINAYSGSIMLQNDSADGVYIASGGGQTVYTRAITMSVGSAASGAHVEFSADGDQAITLWGDLSEPGTASVSLTNTSGASGSYAKLSAGGNQTILMDYDAAGLVQIGSTDGQGMTEISAGGDLTMVAGALLIQGGETVASSAELMAGAGNTMLLSTIYGPVQLKGGVAGSATIDPAVLSIVSNGDVLLQAGAQSTANAQIFAGDLQIAATDGDLTLTNSSTSSATAAINVTNFAFFGPGAVNLNGGTITASGVGTIDIEGLCNGCATNLIGDFSITAYEAPPVDYVGVVTGELLALGTYAGEAIGYYVTEDGTLVLTGRRLNLCY